MKSAIAGNGWSGFFADRPRTARVVFTGKLEAPVVLRADAPVFLARPREAPKLAVGFRFRKKRLSAATRARRRRTRRKLGRESAAVLIRRMLRLVGLIREVGRHRITARAIASELGVSVRTGHRYLGHYDAAIAAGAKR